MIRSKFRLKRVHTRDTQLTQRRDSETETDRDRYKDKQTQTQRQTETYTNTETRVMRLTCCTGVYECVH